MSFLTNEAQAALGARLASEAETAAAPEAAGVPKTGPAAPATDEKAAKRAAPPAPSTGEGVAAEETNETNEKHVPYARFKAVNASKKALQAQAADLQRQLDEANKKLAAPREPSLVDYFTQQAEARVEQQPDDRFASLERRLHNYEVRQAEAELTNELAALARAYPDVPEQVLLQAVIQDPSKQLAQVASEYTAFVNEIEERALERHRQSQKAAAAKAAPPRPDSVGSLPSTLSGARPKTMADARNAALAYFKQHAT
jgi:hypothetical protein